MEFTPLFRDRAEGGRALAREVAASVSGGDDAVVLALPRGGVPTAFEVARALRAELDIFLVRKLGVPGHEELAIGAIASGGVRVLNEDVIRQVGISMQMVDRLAQRERIEMERRERLYREGRKPAAIANRTAILVDDGLATGATMRAAVQALRQEAAARVVVAVPVAPPETCNDLRNEADEVICAATPKPFLAVGRWYQDFSQTTDEEVRALLQRAASGAIA